jgi:hypothetical protein
MQRRTATNESPKQRQAWPPDRRRRYCRYRHDRTATLHHHVRLLPTTAHLHLFRFLFVVSPSSCKMRCNADADADADADAETVGGHRRYSTQLNPLPCSFLLQGGRGVLRELRALSLALFLRLASYRCERSFLLQWCCFRKEKLGKCTNRRYELPEAIRQMGHLRLAS